MSSINVRRMTEMATEEWMASKPRGRRISGLNENQQIASEAKVALGEAISQGSYKPSMMNYGIVQQMYYDRDPEHRDFVDKIRRGEEVSQAAVVAFGDSKFSHQMMTDLQLGAMKECDECPLDLIDCFDTVSVGCGRTVLTNSPRIGDWADEADKLEATNYYTLGDIDCMSFPEVFKRKFAFCYTREDLCNPLLPMYRQQMDQMRYSLQLRRQRMTAQTIANLFPFAPDGSGCTISPIPFIFNDIAYSVYSPIGGEGRWGNFLAADPFAEDSLFPKPSRCDMDMLSFIECLKEDEMGIIDRCVPMQCTMQNAKTITASKTASKFLGVLAGSKRVSIQSTTQEGCNASYEYEEGARDIGQMVESCFLRDMLFKYYYRYCGLSRAEAAPYVDCFWAHGDFRGSFAWATEWEIEEITREGRDTEDYFDREIIFKKKIMEKAGVINTRPYGFYTFLPIPSTKPAVLKAPQE